MDGGGVFAPCHLRMRVVRAGAYDIWVYGEYIWGYDIEAQDEKSCVFLLELSGSEQMAEGTGYFWKFLEGIAIFTIVR